MPIEPANPPDYRTLAQRLANGRLTIREAMRYAVALAEALQKLHEEGRAHGALTPGRIVITGADLEMLPGKGGAITPYTAPEALDGQVDTRGDIFSFGAIFYEMLTGERAFAGTGAALLTALTTAEPAPSGSLIVDCIARNCLAKEPGARWPGMNALLIELRLLTASSSHAEGPASSRHAEPVDLAPVRAEIGQIESRVAARLDAYERTMAALMTQLAAKEGVAQPVVNTDAIENRLAGIEGTLETVRARAEQFERNVAADFRDFEIGLKAQEASVQSVQTALSQTDNLVERVVDALDSLQTAVLDQTGPRAISSVAN